MSKAVISNKIYMRADTELMKILTKELTYRIEIAKSASGKFDTVETIRNYSIPSAGIIAIPQGREDLIPEDYEVVDKRVIHEVDFPIPKLPLRPGQQIVLDAWEDSGILNALVGWGKSYTALWIAFKLMQKTLIVTHNTMLRDQWISDIRILFGIEPGVIGSGQFDIDSPIVVGNVQSLTKHAQTLSDEFGTIILDEMHHCPATTFSNILAHSKAMYRIGLSGTIKRKDGKHVMFRDFFGSLIYQPPQSNTLNPIIKIVRSGRKLKPGVSWPAKINDLMEDIDYQHLIAGIAKSQVAKGHKVLVIADRVGFLASVNRMLGDRWALITGDSADFDAREKSKSDMASDDIDGICGSRQIFAEGISNNPLSCIILTCPITSEILLEQLIGRVMREYPGKLPPVVIDINFAGLGEKRQNNIRLAFYLMKGWEVVMV